LRGAVRRLPATDIDEREHHDSRHALVRGCAALADSAAFTLGIFAVIVANAVVLGLETYDAIARDAGGLLDTLNQVFLAVFVVELAIRMTAYGSRPQDFFRNGWNVFDFVVVAAAFVPGLRENATLLRLVRLARIVRVVRLLPELRVLTVAVARSLPGVASLVVLAVMILYVYGMVGWVVFADANPQEYGSIGDAMLTLFITLTLENLPDQIAMGREVSEWTLLFFLSYALVAAFLLLNILIGVVINSMEEAREIEADRAAAEAGDMAGDAAVDARITALRRALEELESEVRRSRS
jgi:voltage-gated sodium channel